MYAARHRWRTLVGQAVTQAATSRCARVISSSSTPSIITRHADMLNDQEAAPSELNRWAALVQAQLEDGV